MKFKADEIASVIRKEIEDFSGAVETAEVGRVLEVGDGIARCHGLSGAMSGEMVEFASGVTGLVFNLEEHSVGIIILGDYLSVQEGETVRTTGELLSVPTGDALVGRVVNPLGEPLDGGGPIVTEDRRPLEAKAPGVVDRQPVTEPMQTGIKAVDAMTPIGRGQRELIIGDRKTGKSAIALDTIINQKGKGVMCVYVACGQRDSAVRVPAPDIAVQAVDRIVRHAQRFGFVLDFGDTDDGTESFVAHDLHVVGDVGQHRGLVIQAGQ